MNDNGRCLTIFGASNYFGNDLDRAMSSCVVRVEKGLGLKIFVYNS